MGWLFLFGVLILLLFSFVVLFGAPFLPTLMVRTKEALDLLDLEPGQTLLELGSGDGRVLRAAAERGIKSIGYELNPLLLLWSKIRLWKYRHIASVHWANYWQRSWPPTDGIYVFLLKSYMTKLDNKIVQTYSNKHVKLVSFAFEIPGREPVKTHNGLHLYLYP